MHNFNKCHNNGDILKFSEYRRSAECLPHRGGILVGPDQFIEN